MLLPAKIDLELLRDAQGNLRCQELHQIPSDAEKQAWEWFYQTYDPWLRRWALGCHVPVREVKDCLQDVWIEVMKKLPGFASDGMQCTLCSWLHRIVHAKAVDLLRYKSRHPIKCLRSEAEATLISRHASPAAEYEHRVRQEAVQRVLAVLRQRVSELTFEAFHKYWVEGYTVKQIAAELSETQRKVSCRLYKAKHRFRRLCNQLVPKDLLAEV